MAYLIVSSAKGIENRIEIEKEKEIEIGRRRDGWELVVRKNGEEIPLGIEDGTVSRTHARIYRADNKLFIQDLRSKNGTYLDGEIVYGVSEINKTSEIRLGSAKLKVIVDVPTFEAKAGQLISIERAIYDPCKRNFIEGALPRMKEWINRYDPGAYWFAISIQNNSGKTIEEWGVELETSSALKIREARVEGIDYKIELHETYPEPFKSKYIIGVPKEYGIVIPKSGAQRVYFKLRADKPKTTYEISGVFKSEVSGDVPIRAKEFKYLCDAGVSPEAVKAELKKTFSEKDAARLALSFKILQEIDRMCNTGAKTEEYIDRLSVLRNYTEGFSDKFTTQVEEFARFMKQEQLEYLDEEYKARVRRFCTNLVDVWISEFLK